MKEGVLFAWSGGKDSAMALYEIEKTQNYEIAALLTTLNESYDRISMHGVRRVLLEQQAESIGFPLERVLISKEASFEEYESRMQECLEKYQRAGICGVVFGDIFLEDLRKYREEKLSGIGMKGIFPLWKRDTSKLARSFIDSGFEAIITCVDSAALDKAFTGGIFDDAFLSRLPSTVDPCGENGEFHSFVYDGPIFRKRISHRIGEVVVRDNRFYFCDLKPALQDIRMYSERGEDVGTGF
jgi:uncharacterized protein (TIGR00290 family)